MNKKITTISFTALTLGLFIQMIPIFTFTPYQWINSFLKFVRVLSPDINLSYFSTPLFKYHNFTTGFELNFLDLSFYALILFGVILYIKSRGKEIRLLRLSFSIILLTKGLSLFNFIISIRSSWKLIQDDSLYIVLNILSIITSIIWLWASYFVIKNLSQNIILIKQKSKEGGLIYVDSPKPQRFLHLILDLLLSVIICSRFVIFLFGGLLGQIENVLGNRGELYFVIITSHLIYLVFFESIFKSTPAKFLTGSRVVRDSNDEVSINTIVLRSISRKIPFETFSYLGKGNGWHDKLSKTRVVKEENFGVPPQKYLWLIVIFAVIGILSYIGYNGKNKYDKYKWKEKNYLNKIEHIEESLNQLSTDYFYKINNIKNKYQKGKDSYYLKVDIVNENTVVFKYFKIEAYLPTIYEIEKLYERTKHNMPSMNISKEELKKSYTKDYKSFENMKREGIKFIPESQNKYFISEVFKAYKPNITLLKTGGYGQGDIRIEMHNDGWPAKLIDITNIEGHLNWKNELPQEIKTIKHNLDRSIVLRADNFEHGQPYKFTITVLDTIGRLEQFLIKGVNAERIMSRMNK